MCNIYGDGYLRLFALYAYPILMYRPKLYRLDILLTMSGDLACGYYWDLRVDQRYPRIGRLRGV